MNLDDNAKEAVRELGDAINSAIEKSPLVTGAIERLRGIGYEPNLTLRLEIGLYELMRALDRESPDVISEFTEDDIKALRRMKINIGPE